MNSDREVYIAPKDEIPEEDRERLYEALVEEKMETLAKMERAMMAEHDKEKQDG